ncbi:MAG: hypothetical protein BWY35_02266 [Firmicutes bacterium ADurb.Bin248]|nr:MAG: hypothetical protein BWY35_02266 [Firmicutes bacterium ADurb.Bin248]
MAHVCDGVHEYVQGAKQGFRRNAPGLRDVAAHGVLGAGEHVGAVAAEPGQKQRAHVLGQIAREHEYVPSAGNDPVERAQRPGAVARNQRRRDAEQVISLHAAEHGVDALGRDVLPAEGKALVRERERVAHAALGGARDGDEALAVDFRAHARHGVPDAAHDVLDAEAVEVEPLAAREYRGRDALRLRRCEYEYDVRGRLLEGLEQGVVRGAREHVRLVYDVDLARQFERQEARLVDERADVVHAAVRGRVHLDDVRGIPGAHEAGGAFAAGLAVLGGEAVDGAGEYLRGAGLARAARAREHIRVRRAARHDLVFQYGRHMLLPEHLVEAARAVFSVKRLIGHNPSGHVVRFRICTCATGVPCAYCCQVYTIS